MNNISLNSQTPKTPGGISKSLLTPCRRVGLSRNWRRNGPSPFISPLANSEPKQETPVTATRKRKERATEVSEDIQSTHKSVAVENNDSETMDINKTPSRNMDIPRGKRSKTLLKSIQTSQEIPSDELCKLDESEERSPITQVKPKNRKHISPKKKSDLNSTKVLEHQNEPESLNNVKENIENTKVKSHSDTTNPNRSPNDLKRECVVVIQKKAFKNLANPEINFTHIAKKHEGKELSSQTLFDSDSDEVPLSHLNKKEPSRPLVDIDEDFEVVVEKANKPSKVIVSTKSPSTRLKKDKIENTKANKPTKEIKQATQTSFDDEDDAFEDKRTIKVRKTYEKVIKPQKAKSTGSITQKDIEDLKARINKKKKLLLAQSLNSDTAELRSLIKKWQKGCQDALIELLELMKEKSPEQNMTYSDMLKALKIPQNLVGYDSDNDCFVSPNDEDIILSKFKDF